MIILISTKSRPMQLDLCLKSIQYHLAGQYDKIIIMCGGEVDEAKNLYSELLNFPLTEWFFDQSNSIGYDGLLRNIVANLKEDDKVLFNVDDTIWVDKPNIENAVSALNNQDPLLGVSFRLGLNTLGVNRIGATLIDDNLLAYLWIGKFSHWSYPFDLSGSMYRTSTVRKIVEYSKDRFQVPNDTEGRGVVLLNQGIDQRQFMGFFNRKSQCYMADINIISTYNNPFHGTEDTTIDALIEKYKAGYRIDYKNYIGLTHNDPFIGTKQLKFIKE